MLAIRAMTATQTLLLTAKLEALAEYHNSCDSCFAGIYPVVPATVHADDIRDHIAKDTALVLGLYDDAVLRGFGMASFADGYGEIEFLYVDPDLRGQGWGGRLLRGLLEYLGRCGAKIVDLHVVAKSPAVKFYQKYGFATRLNVMTLLPGRVEKTAQCKA